MSSVIVSVMLYCVGEDEETKKQKQKALIDAAFKVTAKTENMENGSNGKVDGLEDSDDGTSIL